MIKRIFFSREKPAASSASSSYSGDDRSSTSASVENAARQPLHLQLESRSTGHHHSFSKSSRSGSIDSTGDRSSSPQLSSNSILENDMKEFASMTDEKVTTAHNFATEMTQKRHVDVSPTSSSTSHISTTSRRVISALDYVLAEMEQHGALGNNEDSSCSNRHERSENIEDNHIKADFETDTENCSSTNLISNMSSSNSLRIESSMLLPEDSLHLIAQMKIAGDQASTSNISTSEHNTEKISSVSLNNKSLSISSDCNFHSSNEVTTDLMGVSQSNRIAPIIAGSAAATKYHALVNHNTIISRIPLFSDPDDVDDDDSTRKAEGDDQCSISHGDRVSVLSVPPLSSFSQGIDILADITSNASPIHLFDGDGEDMAPEKNHGTFPLNQRLPDACTHDFAPVGQSLSIYAAIAAQAGISTCFNPSPPADLVELPSTYTNVSDKSSTSLSGEDHPSNTLIDAPSIDSSFSMQMNQSETQLYRPIGKIRRFCTSQGSYGPWKDLPSHIIREVPPRRWNHLNVDESMEIPLIKGGRLRIFPYFLDETRQRTIAEAINSFSKDRQYLQNSIQTENKYHIHDVLSSNIHELCTDEDETREYSTNREDGAEQNPVCGTEAKPISLIPDIDDLSTDLADLYSLPHRIWNMGVDVDVYNNQSDFTHFDTSQGEFLVLCTIIQGCHATQEVIIKPIGGTDILKDDDEEIILFLGEGDAFELDGLMRAFYHYFLPIKQSDPISLLTFRHGNVAYVHSNGPIAINQGHEKDACHVENNSTLSCSISNHSHKSSRFGHPVNDITEGTDLFPIEHLWEMCAHTDEKKCVSGNIRDGCHSLLLENLNHKLREEDGLCWIQLTHSREDGGGALCKSYQNKLPIRVFRSSSLNSVYAPRVKNNERSVYRYDGLYCVRAMWDADGNETEAFPPLDGGLHTFFLIRLQKKPLNVVSEYGVFFNLLSLQDLWSRIQKVKGVRSPLQFEIPPPKMKLPSLLQRNNGYDEQKSVDPTNTTCNMPPTTLSCSKRQKGVNVVFFSTDKDYLHTSYDSADVKGGETNTTCSHLKRDKTSNLSTDKLSNSVNGPDCNINSKVTSDSSAILSVKKIPKVEEWPLIQASDYKAKFIPTISKSSDIIKTAVSEKGSSKIGKRLKRLAVPKKLLDSNCESNEINGHKHIAIKAEIATTRAKLARESDSSSCLTHGDTKGDPKSPASDKKSSHHSDSVMNFCNVEVNEKMNAITTISNVKPSKYDVGEEVYVEYKGFLYLACILDVRIDVTRPEYLVHYEGFKKRSDKWIPEILVYPVITSTKKRFNAQRRKGPHKRLRKADTDKTPEVGNNESNHAIQLCNKELEEQPTKKLKDFQEPGSKKLDDVGVSPGVEFLPGSCVFVELGNKVHLGKMSKRRKSGDKIEYLLLFDDESMKPSKRWFPLSMIYEINPRTRRLYESKRHFTDHFDHSVSQEKNDCLEMEKTSPNDDMTPLPAWTQNVSSGVDFLPGSTLFMRSTDGSLHLAKMLKKRGKGVDQEYLVHFDGPGKNTDEWVSISALYEINPQTKRIFNKQGK